LRSLWMIPLSWRDQRPSPKVMLSHVAHSNFWVVSEPKICYYSQD
jgi:hypothetical protein